MENANRHGPECVLKIITSLNQNDARIEHDRYPLFVKMANILDWRLWLAGNAELQNNMENKSPSVTDQDGIGLNKLCAANFVWQNFEIMALFLAHPVFIYQYEDYGLNIPF